MNPIANNQTKPNQTQTTPIGARGGISRSRFAVTDQVMGAQKSNLPTAPRDTKPTARASEAWAKVTAGLRERLLPGAWMWIGPLVLAGEVDDCLVLTADSRVVVWVRRRYGVVLGEECRAVGMAGVRICVKEEA
jgi:hypothetical protein